MKSINGSDVAKGMVLASGWRDQHYIVDDVHDHQRMRGRFVSMNASMRIAIMRTISYFPDGTMEDSSAPTPVVIHADDTYRVVEE